MANFDVVLPDATDITDPVGFDWRPVACVSKISDDKDIPFSPTMVGSPAPSLVAATLSPLVVIICRANSDCNGKNAVVRICFAAAQKAVPVVALSSKLKLALTTSLKISVLQEH